MPPTKKSKAENSKTIKFGELRGQVQKNTSKVAKFFFVKIYVLLGSRKSEKLKPVNYHRVCSDNCAQQLLEKKSCFEYVHFLMLGGGYFFWQRGARINPLYLGLRPKFQTQDRESRKCKNGEIRDDIIWCLWQSVSCLMSITWQ